MSRSRHRLSNFFRLDKSEKPSGQHVQSQTVETVSTPRISALGDGSSLPDSSRSATATPTFQISNTTEVAPQTRKCVNTAATPSLWQVAFQSDEISLDEKAFLVATDGKLPKENPELLIQDVIRLTTEKCAEYEARGWHIKTSNSQKSISVRTEATTLLCSVLRFKELLDAGLRFDPTGYGVSAWTVVAFGLQVGLRLSCTDNERH